LQEKNISIMTKKKFKRISMYFLSAFVLYLAFGYLFHLVIFPEKKPDVSTYFKPGTVFYSKNENVTQVVVKQENGLVYCRASIGPYAPGPPEHIHADFDEVMEIENGELSIKINGEVKRIRPGEKLFVPKGAPHKPFNETGDTIRFKGTAVFPEKFAFNLVQVYGLLDKDPNFIKFPNILLQMALLSSEGFDSYIQDGPPVVIQKVTNFILVPLARLCGLKSYHKEFDPIEINEQF
jgi:mannose-6-phosphate isomerase-like protein (cupin superfamily)